MRTRRFFYLLLVALVVALAAPAAAQSPGSVEVTGEIRLAARSDSAGTQFTGGGEFFVGVRGRSDTKRRVEGGLERPGQACRAERDTHEFPLQPPPSGSSVQGAFDIQMLSSEIGSGRYRVCLYLVNDEGTTVATADRIIETSTRPRKLSSPRVLDGSAGGRTKRVRCSGGEWLAWPRPKVTYGWRVNGQVAPGARRSTLRVRAGSRVACRVTLRNGLGSRTAWSRPRRVS